MGRRLQPVHKRFEGLIGELLNVVKETPFSKEGEDERAKGY
jgi:hypothetical protein